MNEYEVKTTKGRQFNISADSEVEAFDIAHDIMQAFEYVSSIRILKRNVIPFDETSGMCQN